MMRLVSACSTPAAGRRWQGKMRSLQTCGLFSSRSPQLHVRSRRQVACAKDGALIVCATPSDRWRRRRELRVGCPLPRWIARHQLRVGCPLPRWIARPRASRLPWARATRIDFGTHKFCEPLNKEGGWITPPMQMFGHVLGKLRNNRVGCGLTPNEKRDSSQF